MKISGNESTGNKSTHNSHILSTSNNYFIWGNQFVGNDQTYICSEKKIILRPPGMLLKCTKCLLLHLLAFCVLCCRWHPPPTDRLVDFFFFGSPQTHPFAFKICQRNGFRLSCCHCVWQTSSGCLFVWQRQNISRCRCYHTVCVTRTGALKGVTERRKQPGWILISDIPNVRDH